MHSLQAVKRAFFADHSIPLVFFESAVCDRLGQGRLESAVHAVRNHLFASCGVQAVRSSCTAEHASDNTTATVQIESSLLSGSFAARLRCVFSFRLFLSSSEKKRKKLDLTTAATAHVRTSAWPGELTVSLLPLYAQCAIRSCLIFDSLRLY